MRELTDRGFFLLYGLCAAAFLDVDIPYITALFLALAVSSCCLLLENRRAKLILLAAGCAAMGFWPKAAAFLPLLVYELLNTGIFTESPFTAPVFAGFALFAPAFAAAFFLRSGLARGPLPFFLLPGLCAALLLWNRSRRLTERERALRLVQDDGTEKALLLKRRNQELREKQDYETYAATLRERNRIAREIHDSVGHLLSRSILMTGALRAVNTQPSLEEPLSSLEASLKEAMDSVRQSVHDLHDDSVDLKEAARRLTREFTFCQASLEYDMGPAVPGRIKYCFLAVQKEALANVMKHSSATQVQICMREHPAFYQMEVRDNGAVRPSDQPSGIGLLNMEERVRNLGGSLRISRQKGFRIFLSIPKKGESI